LRQVRDVPLYEFVCETCAHEFEDLVRADETPACPSCRGTRLRRLMSVVAVGRGDEPAAAAPAPRACGSCGDPRGPGACRMD
jgi:putative FmdB family regulatory protein